MALPGIVFLIVGLLASVGLHELGHLIPAKRFGVKVSQYFIGFGPTLWSRKSRGTEYGIKAIPLGGYVRIAGMLAPGRPDRVRVRRNGTVTLAEEARQASAEELAPSEQSQAFWRLNPARRLVVMFGGPVMNLVLAGACLAIVLGVIGQATPSNQVSAVVPCATDTGTCEEDATVSPASAAGIQVGDVIVSWNGEKMALWSDVQRAIASGGTRTATVVVERGGQDVTLSVTPILLERTVYDASGNPVTDSAGNTTTQETPYVGVSPAYTNVRQPLTAVPGTLWSLTVATARVIAELPQQLWTTTASLFTGASRDANGVVGVVGVADLAGRITSTDAASYSTSARIGDLFSLLASLNISLFVFNLIPLLPLDGGHIAGAIFEAVRRNWAKMRGKADPGPVDMARLMPLSYAVALAFIVMTVILVIADIVNPAF
ncbi:MAG: M50 family metallopeptidase [Ancrocorticia sp.]|nr:M50 family metallopeptidase [Ancrocorticia sp.]